MKPPSSDSFEGQILALVPDLRRYARSLARSDSEGEDLLQDCVERMLTRRGQWRGTNLRGWALTIMTNLYRNLHRSNQHRRTVAMDSIDDIAAPEQHRDPLMRIRLETALNELPEEQRAVLMLVVVEGYSYAEIATMLDIPIGTVMSRLSRARRRMSAGMTAENVIAIRSTT